MATLESALRLAEEWSLPVFPCGQDKKPLTPHGFKDATRNLDEITAMWTQHPGALIGFPTGKASGLLVLDIDPDGLPWYQQHMDKLAPGVVVKTRRGYHLLYRNPPDLDIRCSAGQVARGVDVRANGGYCVMWAAEGLQMTGDLGDATTIPTALLDKLTSTPPAPPASTKLNGHGVAEGGRNSYLARQAGIMRRAGSGPDELRAALSAMNAARCKPPLPDAEVEGIAASIARYPAPASEVADVIPMTWLADVSLHEDSVHLVAGLIPERARVVVYGAPNAGKSTLALDIGFAIAHGIPWRGLATQHGLVVYSSGEGRVGVERRLVALKREHPEATQNLMAMDWNATNLRDVDAVTALIERVRGAEAKAGQACVLVQVDTLATHLYGNDSDAEHMAELLASVNRIRNDIRCAVTLVHHSGKDPTRGARGHSSLLGAIDTEMEVTQDEGVRWCRVTKQRDGALLADMAFDLTPVHLGRDVAGQDISAVVVTHRNLQRPKHAPNATNQLLVFTELQRRAKAGDVAWTAKNITDIGLGLKLKPSTAYAMAAALAKGGYIRASVGGFTLVP